MNEETTGALFEYPYGQFLMTRLEFVLLTGDELEAKLMRIVEVEMLKSKAGWQKRVYQAMEAKHTPPPEPKDYWVSISQAQFIVQLYRFDTSRFKFDEENDEKKPNNTMSRGTLRKSIDSLIEKGFLRRRGKPGEEFGATQYTLNRKFIQEHMRRLPSNPLSIFWGGTKFEPPPGTKNVPPPPTNFESGEVQNLNLPPTEIAPPQVQNLEVFKDNGEDSFSEIDEDEEREAFVATATAALAFAYCYGKEPVFYYHQACVERQPSVAEDQQYLVQIPLASVPKDAECDLCYSPLHGEPTVPLENISQPDSESHATTQHENDEGTPVTSSKTSPINVDARVAASSPHGSSNAAGDARPLVASGAKARDRPKGGKVTRGKSKAKEPEISPDANDLYRDWCSLFKVAVPLGPKTIEAAESLVVPIAAWATDLHKTRAEVLKAIKDWVYEHDTNGFYDGRGVKLYDIAREFEGWQSDMEEQERRKKCGTVAVGAARSMLLPPPDLPTHEGARWTAQTGDKFIYWKAMWRIEDDAYNLGYNGGFEKYL